MLSNNLKHFAAKAKMLSRKLVGKRDNKDLQASTRSTQDSTGIFKRNRILGVVLAVGVVSQGDNNVVGEPTLTKEWMTG